jgi:hypothetical protein
MLSFLPTITLIELAKDFRSIDRILPPYKVCDWGVFTYTKRREKSYVGYMILSTNPGWYVICRDEQWVERKDLRYSTVSLTDLSPSVRRDSKGYISRNKVEIVSGGCSYWISNSVKMDGFESFLFVYKKPPTGVESVKTWSAINFIRPILEWQSEISGGEDDGYHQHLAPLGCLYASLLKNGCYVFHCRDVNGGYIYDPMKQGVPGVKPWRYDRDWDLEKVWNEDLYQESF